MMAVTPIVTLSISKDITLPIYAMLLVFIHPAASSSNEIDLGLPRFYYNVFISLLNYKQNKLICTRHINIYSI